MPSQPNILYVFTDQQSHVAMSCAGNPDLHTPNMDRLAAEGVMFENSYVTQPLCTPCRGSMFTGLMPHECGTPRNNLPIHEHLRGQELGNAMGAAGYDCLYGGKWHVPEGGMPKDNDHGFRVYAARGDTHLADDAIRTLREFVEDGSPDKKPFFMVASYVNPHDICQIGRNMALPWGEIEEPEPRIEEMPNLPANFTKGPFGPEILTIEQEANWALWPFLRNHTPEDWRRLRWGYYRLVEKVDRQIGQILDGLDELGLADDTVLIFSSDHGDGHGAHQWNQKCVLYDEVVRVPFIVQAPGGKPGTVDRQHLISNGLDIFPTICDYAGIDVPAGLRGHSVRPIVEGRNPDQWRDAVFVETFFDGRRGYDTVGRAVRTDRYKYIVYDRGKYREQLFDLQTDPGEMVNLAVEARHNEKLQDHQRLLRTYVTETGDSFRVPGS